jgi:tetratricopeptide (TPR) repeat protein
MYRSGLFVSVVMSCLVSWAYADTSKDAAKTIAVTHFRKGNALKQRGRLPDAEHEYDLALASYADAANVRLARGQVRYLLKKYQGAIDDFDFYLTRVPDDAQILLLRSISKSSLKPEDVSGSCADLLQIKRLGVSLEKAGIGGADKYCHGRDGWDGN